MRSQRTPAAAICVIVVCLACSTHTKYVMDVIAVGAPEANQVRTYADLPLNSCMGSLVESTVLDMVHARLSALGLRRIDDLYAADALVSVVCSVGEIEVQEPGKAYSVPVTNLFTGEYMGQVSGHTGPRRNTASTRLLGVQFLTVNIDGADTLTTLIWQGVVLSEGSTRSITKVAPIFLDELLGEFPTVSDKPERRVVKAPKAQR